MTPGTALVIDASVVVRGLLASEGEAVEVTRAVAGGRTTASAPDVIVPELVNAMRTLTLGGRGSIALALTTLEDALDLPIQLHASTLLAAEALATAVERDLSGYDALYATLSQLLGDPLATADERLAEAVPGALLIA